MLTFQPLSLHKPHPSKLIRKDGLIWTWRWYSFIYGLQQQHKTTFTKSKVSQHQNCCLLAELTIEVRDYDQAETTIGGQTKKNGQVVMLSYRWHRQSPWCYVQESGLTSVLTITHRVKGGESHPTTSYQKVHLSVNETSVSQTSTHLVTPIRYLRCTFIHMNSKQQTMTHITRARNTTWHHRYDTTLHTFHNWQHVVKSIPQSGLELASLEHEVDQLPEEDADLEHSALNGT